MSATIVESTAGKLEGKEDNGVHVFKGIPYAAPPVGELRFRAPQPVAPWTGVREATSFGPVACQQPSPLEAMFESQRQPTSEDCLTLNVWTPAVDGGRPPGVGLGPRRGPLVRAGGGAPCDRA